MLVRLSRGQGVRTGLLTLTRGDGGQNAIGPELFDALAVLRSEELAAIHRYDGVEQYFGLSSDFGYSFCVDENLDRWGRDAALGDVVRVVRSFRPDVIAHAAAGGARRRAGPPRRRRGWRCEAFRAAADPARFPGRRAAPWQARKIYQGGVGGGARRRRRARVAVTTGRVRPAAGHDLAAARARRAHDAPVAGHEPGAGARPAAARPPSCSWTAIRGPGRGPRPTSSTGLDLTFAGLLRFVPDPATAAPFLEPGLAQLQARLDAARAAYDATAPEKTLPSLQRLLVEIRALAVRVRGSAHPARRARPSWSPASRRRRSTSRPPSPAPTAWRSRPSSTTTSWCRARSFLVTTTIANNGARPDPDGRRVAGAHPRAGRCCRLAGTRPELGPGERAVYRHRVCVPEGAAPSQPDWTRTPGADRFAAATPALAGRAWAPPDVRAIARYHSGGVTAQAPRRARSSRARRARRTGATRGRAAARSSASVTVVPRAVRPRRARDHRGPRRRRARRARSASR